MKPNDSQSTPSSSRFNLLTRAFAMIAAGVVFLDAAAPSVVAQLDSQDGYSFSGSATQTPIGDTVGMTGNDAFPGGVDLGTIHFRGAASDGTNIWLAPADSDHFVKVSQSTGAMTAYTVPSVGTTSEKFVGAINDGTDLWFVPFGADKVVRLDPSSGSRTVVSGWPAGMTVSPDSANFAGGVFDGTYVWLVPLNADRVIRIDPSDESMTGFNTWPGSFAKGSAAFWGGVFDGQNIWLVPYNADRLISIDKDTGVMTEHLGWPAGFTKGTKAFAGGTFDGTHLWLAPYNADRVIKVDVSDGSMEGFDTWPVGFTKGNAAFAGANFDGADIWLTPFGADRVVKLDKDTGTMSDHSNWPTGFTKGSGDFAGAVYNDQTIWMVPAEADRVVQLTDTPVPSVTSIVRQDPSDADTNDDTVMFRVTFNKDVNNVDTTDFALTVGGTAVGTVDSVSASSGSQVDVTITAVDGDGTMRLDLNASGTGIEDDFQNAISGGFTSGESYSIDNTAPVITSAATAAGTYKSAFTYTITASGGATSFGATGLPAGLGVNPGTGEISGSATESGTFNATITATDPAGNIGSQGLEITVDKVTLTISGVTANDRIYDGTVIATLNTSGAALVGVVGGDDVTLDSGAAVGNFASKNIGASKPVTVTGFAISGADAGNYSLTQPGASADVGAATLTVAGVTATDKVYDATTAAVISTAGAALAGIVPGDDVVLEDGAATGEFVDKNVGANKIVNISGIGTSGADAGNYALVPATATADITAAALGVVGVLGVDRIYDATTMATLDVGGAALDGVIPGDVVTVNTGSAAGAFADKNVGENKAITVTGITISGTDSGNYVLSQPAPTADVTAADLTVAGVTAESRMYDGTTDATLESSGAAFVGVVGGDDISIDTTAATASFDNKTVGTGKSVTITGIAATGADAGNYTVTQPSASADITAAVLAVTGVTAADKVYDATVSVVLDASNASPAPVVPGDDVTLEMSGVSGVFENKNVGAEKMVTVTGLTLNGSDAGNYSLTQPMVKADITAAEITVDGVTAEDKAYDGTTDATVDAGSATILGELPGDDVSLVAGGAIGAFIDKNVGSNKPVVVSGLTLGGADGGNYTVIAPVVTANITQAPVTIAGVTAADKVYDGTTAATVDASAATVVGAVDGDDVSASGGGASGEFESAAVGAAKPVHVTGIALAGADALNYSLTQPTTTADITKADVTVTLDDLNHTYDGTAKSVTVTTDPGGLAVDITYDGSSTAPTDAGSYAVVATVNEANHGGNAQGTLVIAKAAATVVITDILQVADGSPKPVTVTTDPDGLSVEVTYNGETTVPSDIGGYEVVATITDANYSGTASDTLVIDSNTRATNLSARAMVGTGDNVLIPGFVVQGSGPKKVLIRGIGPTLGDFDIQNYLEQPKLVLMSGGETIAENVGWINASNAREIESVSASVGAFPLAYDSGDSAILTTLEAGVYSVRTSGVGGTTGLALVEVYDADESGEAARLANISARAQVGVGDEVVIPGLAIEGNGPRRILIRGVGPTLEGYGVQGFLEDPVIRVYSGSDEIAANDNWQEAPNAAEIVLETALLGAFQLNEGSADAAVLITVDPGPYTVSISGTGGTTGIALFEIYEIRE